MKVYAAKYYYSPASKDYEIVIYENKTMAENCPHDYILAFNKYQWRRMGCRVPKKDENMAIELIAKEI